MKEGDLVKYATNDIMIQIADYPKNVKRWNNRGLLVSFEESDNRFYVVILDNSSGKIVRRHISDVELANQKGETDENR